MRDAPQELTGWRGNSVGRIPVILLCDPSDYTSVAQVDAQFADYLTKPVNPYEAYIRIDGVLRRTYGKPSGSGQIDRDGWGLDPFTWTVWNKDIRLKLPPKEFDIIWTLCNQLGQTVSRAQLLQVAWGRPISPDSRTLESHMTRVRRKLERLFGDDFRMVSVYSKGYRLEILV
jgi:DNA-binding response OmpR family regulator